MIRVTLSGSVEGGRDYTVTFERSAPAGTLTVIADGQRSHAEIPAAETEELVSALRDCQVVVLPASPCSGLANGYTLEIEVDMARASFSWAHHPPTRWEALGELVTRLQRLAFRVSSSYSVL